MATTTYSVDSDLVLDTGQQIEFSNDINKASVSNLKDSVRVKAYNFINNKLRGRTAVPATHISGQVKEIEKDLVIGWLLGSGLAQERQSDSEWPKWYLDRAKEALEIVTFPASASTITSWPSNTGDGTLTISALNDWFTMTERWEIVYVGNDWFYVYGSRSGQYPSLEVGEEYPDKQRLSSPDVYDGGAVGRFTKWANYPFYCTVTAGITDFVLYDRFVFNTYSAHNKSKLHDFIPIVREG